MTLLHWYLFLLRWLLNITWVLASFSVFYLIFRSLEIAALLTIALSDLNWGRPRDLNA